MCRPAGALEREDTIFLYTCRPAGAKKAERRGTGPRLTRLVDSTLT